MLKVIKKRFSLKELLELELVTVVLGVVVFTTLGIYIDDRVIKSGQKVQEFSIKEKIANSISPLAVYEKMQTNENGWMVLDIRDVISFDREHLENSINIPLEYLFSQSTSLNGDKDIFLIDENGTLSKLANLALYDLGFSHLYIIEGGLFAWKDASLSTLQQELAYKLVKVEDLYEINKNDEQMIIDSRSEKEYKYSHIKNAKNINWQDFKVDQLGFEPSSAVFIYGNREGNSSALLAKRFSEAGFPDVYVVEDGFTSWERAGYPIEKALNN